MKVILDSIAQSEDRKKELIRGDAVDKAEQLSECVCVCVFVCTYDVCAHVYCVHKGQPL